MKQQFLAVAVCLALVAGVAQADMAIRAARVEDGSKLSTETLVGLAQTQGSLEIVQDDGTGAVSRHIVDWGTPGVGAPGFTSMAREAALAGKADAEGVRTLHFGQAELVWAPAAKGTDAPAVATAMANGEVIFTEQRWEDANGAPLQLRVDFADGASLVQVFSGANAGSVTPAAGFAPVAATAETTTGLVDPAKALVTRGVQFTAPTTGTDYSFDSGYWPGGDESPGGFPLQVRLRAAAVANYAAEAGGDFHFNEPVLNPGAADGSWN